VENIGTNIDYLSNLEQKRKKEATETMLLLAKRITEKGVWAK